MNKQILSALLLPGLVCVVFAARPAAWELNSYKDFAPGRFSGVSLDSEGRLLLAPQLETLFASEQPIVWSLAQARDGTLYAATGHRGRVFRIDPSGKGSVLWTADEPEVFALALDSDDRLYIATSPKGKIYRLENGKATEYFAPQCTYIWALAFDSKGVLYAGTGEDGKIFRIEGPGKGEVYYDTGQSHVTALAFDREGRLLAGSEPNGILYRVTARDKAFVLHDANLPEIRAIVPAADGSIYVAAMGGSLRQRVPAAATGVAQFSTGAAAAASTTVTVEAATQAGLDLKPKPEAAKPAAAVPAAAVPTPEITGVEKSALYRIHADNTVETLWSSKEENIYDVLPAGDSFVITTDEPGRIYRLAKDRKLTLLAQLEEAESTRLLETPRGLLIATGNLGKVMRVGGRLGETGSYEAPVHDAGAVARWGRMSWRAEGCEGCALQFRTRAGNSARPDKTWSEWSEPLSGPEGATVLSPNARFIQWKAEFSGKGGRSPVLDSASVAYLPQNTPPVVNSVTVINQVAAKPAATAATQPATGVYSVTVTDTGESSSMSAGTPAQKLPRISSEEVRISWQAEDYDGDRLTYVLYFRGEGEREWKLLKDRLLENSWVVESNLFADGKYFFRVVASDRADNAPAAAREAEMTSSGVIIDQTPPVVSLSAPRRDGAVIVVNIEAADTASALTRAEYSLDAGPWTMLTPEDGIPDSRRERFSLRLPAVSPGEHLLVVRAWDSADNAGLAKMLLP